MVKKSIFLIAVLTLVAGPILAQEVGDFPLRSNIPAKSTFSLFDPSRFHMTNSFSLMYSSANGQSQSLGVYLNSIEYQVSDPLKIRLDLGYVQNTSSLFNSNSRNQSNGRILPGVSISWKPAKNLFFHFNYREMPVYYNGGFYDSYYPNSMFYESGREY
jgi:hypothetical protein